MFSSETLQIYPSSHATAQDTTCMYLCPLLELSKISIKKWQSSKVLVPPHDHQFLQVWKKYMHQLGPQAHSFPTYSWIRSHSFSDNKFWTHFKKNPNFTKMALKKTTLLTKCFHSKPPPLTAPSTQVRSISDHPLVSKKKMQPKILGTCVKFFTKSSKSPLFLQIYPKYKQTGINCTLQATILQSY